jgi:hypothetical protein
MPIVLGQNLTGREAYLLLLPAILDAGLESVCQPLIDWLTVGGDPYLRGVARAVGDLDVEARADRSDRQDCRSALDQPKGVREKFGDRLTDHFLPMYHA